jgi:hypothetical protein
MLAPLNDPLLAGFVARLDEINQQADASPGFVWRFQTDAGNATSLRPNGDDRILFHLSAWETLDDLRQYEYRSQHSQLIGRRTDWFTRSGSTAHTTRWRPPLRSRSRRSRPRV